jgi:DNA polymerase/3'-5' exonuclease PolX
MNPNGPTNAQIADVLGALAERLDETGEPNPYRVRAYRVAAETIRAHETPLADLYTDGGLDALMELPGIGDSLALHIARYIETGRLGGRGSLSLALDPTSLFASVPGIGRPLARRLVAELGVQTLAELERACYDGRARALAGMGPRRLRALRMQLNTLLQWAALERYQRPRPRPPQRLRLLRQAPTDVRPAA